MAGFSRKEGLWDRSPPFSQLSLHLNKTSCLLHQHLPLRYSLCCSKHPNLCFVKLKKSKLLQPLWKMIWSFLKILKMELPFDPVVPLLGIYPKNTETPVRKTKCTPVFTAVLFTITKIWQQPKCPSVDGRIKMLRYIYTMEHYMAVKPLTLCDSMDGPGE